MVSFDFSPEQKEIMQMALKFAKEEMMPKAHHYDESAEFPLPILQKAWELGLVNTCIPSTYGGSSLSAVDAILITQNLAYGCMGMTTSIMANDLALLPIAIGGTHEQKEKFLRPFTESYKIASFCLTEPNNGSDAGGITTSIREEKDCYVISGQKMWITNAGHADLFVVYGTLDPNLKHKGISVVVVPKDAEGLEIGKAEKKMGHRCSDTRSVTFHNVRVPKDHMIGRPGGGWEIAMKTLNHSRPLVASSALGGAQCAFDYATQYAKERKQFRVPLANHQAIQFMVAEMAMKIEAMKLLCLKAAWLLDQGQDNTELASYAKAFCADSCMQIATDAVQIYGGYGYSKEYPVEKIMRDAKLIQIYEGTSQIQRLIIAREVFTKS